MNRKGFTIAELMLGVTVAGLLTSIALPGFAEMRDRAAVRSVTAEFVSTHSWARTVAMRYGRLTYLLIDDAAGRYWVMTDTTLARTGIDTIGVVHDVSDDNVTMDSPTGILCFDARGIASSRMPCPTASTVIRFAAAGDTTEITVTALGKVLQ